MNEMLERYNNALGEGGNAEDIISNPSVEIIVETENRSNDADSILNRVSVTGEEDSVDSGEFVVVMARRRKRMIHLQILWMVMMVMTVCLGLLQVVLFLGQKK